MSEQNSADERLSIESIENKLAGSIERMLDLDKEAADIIVDRLSLLIDAKILRLERELLERQVRQWTR